MNVLQRLILKTADDAVVLGHRNSEWTGIGPILEEDIAFSSMAQDKIGHALALYQICEKEFGGMDPDSLLFSREPNQFLNCVLVEMPIGDYSYTLTRHYLFDKAEQIRYDQFSESTFAPLKNLAKKIKGEIKYHVLHAEQWMLQLINQGNEESRERIFNSLQSLLPLAMGMFEPLESEDELISTGVYMGEAKVQAEWSLQISSFLSPLGFDINLIKPTEEYYGGRKGVHTENLSSLLSEMREVYESDPGAEW